MKRKRYSEEQIIRILREIDSGKSVAQACREYNGAASKGWTKHSCAG